jgi:hypothetical protein
MTGIRERMGQFPATGAVVVDSPLSSQNRTSGIVGDGSMCQFGVFRYEPSLIRYWRKFLEAMESGSSCPWKFFARVSFDRGHKPGHVVEHRRSSVSELIDAVRPGKHPALAT